MQKLHSNVIGFEEVDWKKLQFIQQENFKEWNLDGNTKLDASLLKFQFVDPFKVWENEGIIYCLDGKHRVQVLLELIKKGINVPDVLPAVFLECENKKVASELVLLYSSSYARITANGMVDFVKLYGLDFEQLKLTTDLPTLDLNILNDQFLPIPNDFIGLNKEKPITLTITFKQKQHIEDALPEIRKLITNYEGAICSVSAGEL
jgi:hypothetical protein